MDEIYTMTASELKRALWDKQFGVEELTRAYIERIKKYDGKLNTISEMDESAIAQAKRLDSTASKSDLPLFGLPILVKDNIDVAGLHTTAGSLALADNLVEKDAPIISNLRQSGAVILGKTNMTEFANYTTEDMPNGYSSKGGQVKNAYDENKDPSGSSTGSAVAMSAGFCAASIGTDTSFSIVGCATENGVVGLKPSHGSLSSLGIIPISHTLDSAGPFAGRLSDAILVYSGMKCEKLPTFTEINPRELKIGINTFDKDQVSKEQLERYDTLFDALRTDGVEFTDVYHQKSPHMENIMKYEFKHDLEEYLSHSNARLKTLDNIVKFYENDPERMMKYGILLLRSALDEASGNLDDKLYLEALSEREKHSEQMLKDLREYDACVMTGPTDIMHFTGLPSVALKLCMADDNTPRGIILYGADEFRLFNAALTIEKYCLPVFPPSL
ncbi:MAG: amidase family protein [Oscillospiraceae bacterium]|nr:amidase family protein [Oscillospiraceae bacterium]